MWNDFNSNGFLQYPNFLETVTNIIPMYAYRAIGGTLYFVGVIVMVYNLIMTAKAGSFVREEAAEAPALAKANPKLQKGEHWHRWIERRPTQMLIASLVVILIGGLIEMVPTFLIKSNVPTISSVKPYTPLELIGRDIYIQEGCNACHTQMVRPFRSETERYGEYSKAGEFVYDHPFLWGSKRTGPDLAREGSLKLKKPNSWHFKHFYDPRSVSPGSIMPAYPWLLEKSYDTTMTAAKIRAMITLGVPYEEDYAAVANEDVMKQANEIVADMKDQLEEEGFEVEPDREVVALIAYLQRLGVDIEKSKTAENN